MKLNFKNALKVTKRELLSFLDNPSYYVVFIVFLLLWNFLVFKNVFIIGESSLGGWFGILPWLLMIFSSAVTMSAIAKEREEGTLEFILTHPIKEIDVIIGKFLGSLVYTFTAVMFTLPIAVLFSRYGTLDWGVYSGQLLASLFLLASLTSLGVFVSTLFTSQIAALLVTAGASFGFVVLGSDLVTISLPLSIGNVLEKLSLLTHFNSMSRGVVDIVDVLYFILFTILFLLLSNLQLLKLKFGKNKVKYTGAQSFVVVFVGLVVMVSMVTNNSLFRLDLTQNNIYTLSDSTKKVLKELPQPITIRLFVSNQLPSQYSPILRELQYLLTDYKTVGGDKIVIETKDPSTDSSVEQDATALGIQKVQFNVIGKEELQLKTGYLGLALKLGDKSETIPFVQSTEDLEYELTSLIKKLTTTNKKTVAFLSGHDEKSVYTDATIVNQELSKLFDVTALSISESDPHISKDLGTLVVAGGVTPYAEYEKTALKEYLNSGGNAVFLYDSYGVTSSLGLSESPSDLPDILKELYGVKIEKNLAYDTRQNESLSLQEGITSFVLPYPLWLRAQVKKNDVPFRTRLESLGIPWASSITYDGSLVLSKFNYRNILTTSLSGGVLESPTNIDPRQTFSQVGLKEQVVGIVIESANASGRVAVIGDSDFLVDGYLQRAPENMAFGLDLISWSAGEDTLSDIQVKSNVFGRFSFTKDSQPTSIKYIVSGVAISIPLLVGITRYVRRRLLRIRES